MLLGAQRLEQFKNSSEIYICTIKQSHKTWSQKNFTQDPTQLLGTYWVGFSHVLDLSIIFFIYEREVIIIPTSKILRFKWDTVIPMLCKWYFKALYKGKFYNYYYCLCFHFYPKIFAPITLKHTLKIKVCND